MDIQSSSPLLEGWRWETRDVDYTQSPIVIAPGETFTIARHTFISGWITNISLSLDNEFVLLRLAYDNVRVSISPSMLDERGAVQPDNTEWWLSRYSLGFRKFTMKLTPSEPVAFAQSIRADIINPATKPDGTPNITARLLHQNLTTKEIIDKDLFIASLHRLYPKPEPIQPPIPPPVQPPPRLPPVPPPAPPPDELGIPEALPPWRRR